MMQNQCVDTGVKSASLRWSMVSSPRELLALAPQWDALAAVSPHPLVSDSAWTLALREAFLDHSDDFQVFVLREGDRLCAVLPLVRTSAFPFRVLSPPDNEHNPYWSFAFDPDAHGAAAAAVVRFILFQTDCLYLKRLHLRSSLTRSLARASVGAGRNVSLIESELGDAFIDLPRTLDGLAERIPAIRLSELRRKRRQLERRAKVQFETVVSLDGLDDKLEECFRLEASGWKGKDGSPILADPRTHRFYVELARRKAAAGQLALQRMLVDGKLASFELSVRGCGRTDVLKISFDPSLGAYSPGNVLRLHVIETELMRGEVRTFHLGRPSLWKSRWATRVEPLCTMRVYRRSLRGALAYWSGPMLRGWLKHHAIVKAGASAIGELKAWNLDVLPRLTS